MTKRPFRFQYSLATLLALSLVCGGGMMWWYGRYGRWAAALADPAKRNEALFNLLNAQRYHGTPKYTEKSVGSVEDCKINHVIASRQPQGPPVYAVFRESRIDHGCGPGLPKGHLIVIDGEGYILPWFSGANVIDSGVLFEVAPDQPTQCADFVPYGLTDKHEGVCVLYVVNVSSDLTPILLVAYDRDGEPGPRWWWKLNSDNGEIEIQLGPRTEREDGSIVPTARFSWSHTQHRYVGPDGGPDQHFMRLDPAKQSEQMRQFFDGSKTHR